jgi:type II secretory pathway predicted ATPase ExeA
MYETYFNLHERPFASMPRIDHYYPAVGIEAARTTLIRCIERSEGTGMVVGPSGTGKTLLCQLLAEHFSHAFQVALLTSGHLGSRRALLQAILYELAQPYRGMDEGELRLALIDYITLSDDCPRGAVLLVDEAHMLPLRLLDEVRMLTNLMRAGQPAVRLVLAGGRALEERFASPKLESFSQRLSARCYLQALNAAETQEYVHAWIAAVGGSGPDLFPAETCHSVYKATDGAPRLINQLCDHALLLAYAAGQRKLDPAHVEEAWADLQQLPTPWNEQAREGGSGVIEFGRLEDEAGDGEQPQREEGAAADETAAPAIHLSREADEIGTNDAEVEGIESDQQLQHIQELLADVQAEFQPAGSIGPEVELLFDDAAHPFREAFAEEEVITERYASPAETQPTVATAVECIAAEATCVSEVQAPEPRDQDVGGAEYPQTLEPGLDGPYGPPSQTVPMHPRNPAHPMEPDDADMVVVEEGYEDIPGWPVRNVVPVRRQEYGRLFATLRRG